MENREQAKALVREVLAEMVAQMVGTVPSNHPTEQWVSLSRAWKPLGYPSYNALYRDIQRGLFRQGKEFCDRRKPGAKIGRIQIDLIAVRKRLKEDPSTRRAV